jgi:prolyl-tRNA synthetase
MRGREFMMKDAYSFDLDDEGANASYDAMYAAYERIFTRCGLEFRPVEADTGAIGGSRSHEFQVLADSGEDAIVSCSACQFAANVEQAELTPEPAGKTGDATPAYALVETPNQRTIADVSGFLERPSTAFIKTLIVDGDDALYAVLLRGDHELNEIKLKKVLGVQHVALATDAQVVAATGAPVGFAGPVGLTGVTEIIADHGVAQLHDAVVGANQADAHFVHVDVGRDFTASRFADLRLAVAGDPCPRCASPLLAFRGIEVGHVFFLGTEYTEAMSCNYLDTDGRERPMVMGCYGIGVSRTMAATVEQNHDEHGIVWPPALAPYQVIILPLQMNKPEVVATAEALYETLLEAGVEVLLDDRKERAGSKFKDAELFGIPLRLAIGARGLAEGKVELKPRAGGPMEMVPVDDIGERVAELLR